ncbi:MAG: bifunctional [glutamate--ammonia ligase]-adenylyl-L-tyrosine phosphorylase/[glutamate--ammonia-ligase] adenylyltransferase [Planctomycetales bacterium]|nr:bifunctional [glutamate--ammonia ligase]-adenylyl-L-tyrosine phosphorylase/[glutamate--ammonia-ligase] adenylyltransferase [Planctomycetales bacterium]
MQVDNLRHLLDSEDESDSELKPWGVENVQRARANLVNMAAAGVPLDLLGWVTDRLRELLPKCSDADMALNNLERFVTASRNPLGLVSLLEREPSTLTILVQLFATSQYLSDILIADPDGFEVLRLTEGEPLARQAIIDEITSEVASLHDAGSVMAALRQFKRRETLRISYVADALVEAATRFARRHVAETRGWPRRPDGQPARFAVLGLGKLGGNELNYSSDIDLVLLCDGEGRTDGPRPLSNVEYFGRVAGELVRLLSEMTDLGQVYRVDLRLRPEGQRGPVVTSFDAAMRYYDFLGRTWERQAFVKARVVAGDVGLGEELLGSLESWIYRQYLGLADIVGIKALKRRLERRESREGDDARNVKTGRGGLRDIEFVIQFLQLLNGGDLPELRTGNTLDAIDRLEAVGCLTHKERTLLEQNYAFLRKVEHRLQIMFDLQTHMLPEPAEELNKLALRLGYTADGDVPARTKFEREYLETTHRNRQILDHLLHDAFGDDSDAEPEVDLVLDPDPPLEKIEQVLGKYGFRHPREAYEHLMSLATERIRFLSTRRCRMFLASIAPRLLAEIAATADPDGALVNLDKVSDSLGGKGVLWELFSASEPSLKLYVEMCATSPLLSGILVSSPGMIDELMDSLVLDRVPELAQMRETLTELCQGAEDLDPILHSFKNSRQLRVGVRDILGKDDISATTGALSDIAQVCLEQITDRKYASLIKKFGVPTIADGPRAGQPSEFVILALGKFGGREMNYMSDLDIVFLYEDDGRTVPRRARAAVQETNNQHFFSELGQRIIKTASRLGPYGRLYEVDPRLRPTGRSGALAVSISAFRDYFLSGSGRLWERQALCKSRVVYGSDRLCKRVDEVVNECALQGWQPKYATEIREMRHKLEETASATNLKRGPGGIVDVEFIAQMLELRHGVTQPNTLMALDQLRDVGALSPADHETLVDSYRFLRSTEARLRLMSSASRDDLPEDEEAKARLARQLGYANSDEFYSVTRRYVEGNREAFNRLFDAAAKTK